MTAGQQVAFLRLESLLHHFLQVTSRDFLKDGDRDRFLFCSSSEDRMCSLKVEVRELLVSRTDFARATQKNRRTCTVGSSRMARLNLVSSTATFGLNDFPRPGKSASIL